jgi:hypothetical protein
MPGGDDARDLADAYAGDANVDAWLEGISDRLRSRRARVGSPPPMRFERVAGNAKAAGFRGNRTAFRDVGLASPDALPGGPQLVTHHPQS